MDADGDGSFLPEDCDDTDSAVFPGATEVCDGTDNDCDGVVDNEGPVDEGGALDARSWFADEDGDGWGDVETRLRACEPPEGYLNQAGDCDDTDPQTHPGGTEVCDPADKDEDCSGAADDDDPEAEGLLTWYADPDGDGYGTDLYVTEACDQPPGTADNADDCLEGDPEAHPGAVEIWYDGIDQDCDQGSDWDADGDGWDLGGDADCDDTRADVHPDAEERCGDGVDQDCSGSEVGCVSELDIARALLFGVAAGDRAGVALAPAGDLDGDDVPDLFVGADLADGPAGADAGAAYFTAGPWGGERSLSAAPWTLTGATAGETAGAALAGDFDADGDGLRDLLVGAPYSAEAGARAGAVYLLLGPGSGGELSASDATWFGAEAAMAGEALAAGGDLDGDGLDDLVIGGPWDETALEQAGVVYVLHGPATSGGDLTEAPGFWTGEDQNDQAGTSVATGGDVDGDGLDDVLVGAWWSDRGGRNRGTVYVLHGPATGEASLGDADGVLVGEDNGDEAGSALAFTGDLNGDGLDDFVVGASGKDEAATAAGGAFVVHGPATGSTLADDGAVLLGEEEDGLAGWSVAGVGDVDADGVPDLLVGAPGGERGAAYLVLGPVSGRHSLGTQRMKLEGERPGDGAGIAVAGPGDLDGDGRMDLAVGAWDESSAAEGAGAVYLILATDLDWE